MKYFYLFLLCACACAGPPDKELRLNQIQIIGSHNSYKQSIEKPIFDFFLEKDSTVISLDYHHLPLKQQLDLGVRGLEIDILHDPAGSRYKNPVGLKLIKQKGLVTLPYDTLDQLALGGLKVLHVPDIDFRSHCLTFIACLSEVKEWSDANPQHLPIIITINPKDTGVDQPGFTRVLPMSSSVLDSVDQEILSVFHSEKLITPDVVKGEFATLREAVTTAGWPALNSTKGKILFVLDAPEAVTEIYIKSSLKGKAMFPNVPETYPDAAFFIMNDPHSQHDQIKDRVSKGFMVRTRADADTQEARTGDLTRLEAAISSGAQLISTDYYKASLSPSGNFQVNLSGGKYQQCNPVTAPSACGL